MGFFVFITGTSKSLKEIEVLRVDLKNAPNHVFEDHRRCRDEFCKLKAEPGEANVLETLEMNSSFFLWKFAKDDLKTSTQSSVLK